MRRAGLLGRSSCWDQRPLGRLFRVVIVLALQFLAYLDDSQQTQAEHDQHRSYGDHCTRPRSFDAPPATIRAQPGEYSLSPGEVAIRPRGARRTLTLEVDCAGEAGVGLSD